MRAVMRIVVAPQEFKGTLTSQEAATAIALGARQAAPNARIDLVPLSDGGPDLASVVLASAPGRHIVAKVTDPLSRPVDAGLALLDGGTAVIEMAAAAGLKLLSPAEMNPGITTTRGVGELIVAALDAGCPRIIVGCGGSATNDGGAGMASALGVRLLDDRARDLPPGGAALVRLDRIDASALEPRLRETEVIAATDVTNPLCGPEGASLVYGPQKGASPDLARELDAALAHYAEVIERDIGVSVASAPGAGAAGGLGAGLIAFCSARVRSGFEVVAEIVGLEGRIRGADLVLTGEGRLDAQTAYGKVVARVAAMARGCGVPVIVIPGSLGEGWEDVLPSSMVEPVAGPESMAAGDAAGPLAVAARRAVQAWLGAAR